MNQRSVKIEYKTRGQGDWNKAWKNDPEFRKFFKKKRPGVVWDNLTVDERLTTGPSGTLRLMA